MLAVSMSPPIAHYPTVPKRPKLSLQTSQLPINYGTSSRGLSTIATPTAAVTPTTFNTFTNTYDLTHRPSPTSANASPSVTRSTSGRDRLSRSQSPRPKRNDVAYSVSLPYGIKPILKNTPYPRVRNNSISASPRSTTRRVFFPAPKQVIFKNIIEEEVVTKVYTARHSDLFQPEIETKAEIEDKDVASEESSSEEVFVSTEQSAEGSSITISSTKRRKCRRRNSLDLTTTGCSSTEAEPLSVATPSSSKKQRKWEWTLAPVQTKAQALTDVDWQTPSQQEPSSNTQPESASESDSRLPGSISATTPTCQASLSIRAESTSQAPVRAQPQQTIKLASQSATFRSNTLPTQNPISTTLLLSPLYQKRAGSLDSSPRKRKAECLEIPNTGLNTSSSRVDGNHNLPSYRSSDDGTAAHVRGQMGMKRRDRAATL